MFSAIAPLTKEEASATNADQPITTINNVKSKTMLWLIVFTVERRAISPENVPTTKKGFIGRAEHVLAVAQCVIP